MKRILNIIIIILLSTICLTGTAQKIAVKSNLLGWATATPTLGAEIGLDDRWTLNTHIYYNPFTFKDNRNGSISAYNPKCVIGSVKSSTGISSGFMYYTPISTPDKFRFLSEFFPMLKNIVIKATLTEPGYLTVINGF